jgi:hypothetical protein
MRCIGTLFGANKRLIDAITTGFGKLRALMRNELKRGCEAISDIPSGSGEDAMAGYTRISK